MLEKLKLIPPQGAAIRETIELMRQTAKRYGAASPLRSNPAKKLAALLHGRMPVIYGGQDYFDAVAVRWKGQINENSKTFAAYNVLPEMNHNEIVGWEVLTALTRKFAVVFLRDRQDHPRVQVRMKVTQGIIRPDAACVTEVWAQGRSPLARMFSLTSLGDYVSLYLALLNGVDPTPVTRIDFLKKSLAKAK